jgi:hypothetical protein
MKRLEAPSAAAPGPFVKLALAAGGIVAIVAGAALSVVLVAAGLVVGAAAWGYVAWKTRALRRAVRDGLAAGDAAGGFRPPLRGRVFDGEAVSVPDERR